jgi:hypothetical protein
MEHSHYSGRGHRHRRSDKHNALKTSLQVVGLLICLRVLLPYMFPREREYEHERERQREHYEEPPRYNDPYNEHYIPPQSRIQEMNERRRITEGSEWGGTTAYEGSDVDVSDAERERRRERRERRRRRRIEY